MRELIRNSWIAGLTVMTIAAGVLTILNAVELYVRGPIVASYAQYYSNQSADLLVVREEISTLNSRVSRLETLYEKK